MPPDLTPLEDEEEIYAIYFGQDAPYYLHTLKKYQEGSIFSFNLAAFFLGILWMFYRKLYLPALGIMVLATAISFFTQHLETLNRISPEAANALERGSSFTIVALIGFLGNWFYMRQARATVNKILATEPDDAKAGAKIQRAGGVTLVPHIILAALAAVALLLYSQL